MRRPAEGSQRPEGEPDPTDEEGEICDLRELALVQRRYKSDVIRDDISNIEYMEDELNVSSESSESSPSRIPR